MYQPKTLAELARKVINKNIVSAPHLRDLPFPQRFIRDLEETFAEDRLDFEELLSTLTDFNQYYYQPYWKEYLSTSYGHTNATSSFNEVSGGRISRYTFL
jgi:hypothetical protein